ITVTGVNDAPTATDKQFSTTEDGPVVAGTLAGDDIDADDDSSTLSFVLSAYSGKGILTDKGDGDFTFDPGTDFDALSPGAKEDVTFTSQTKDSHGALSAPATVTITVTGANDAPTAAPVFAALGENDPSATSDFLGGDADSDDGPRTLTYAITTSVPAGQGT